MYVHSPNQRSNRSVNIPYNYGGVAFRRDAAPETKIHRGSQSQPPQNQRRDLPEVTQDEFDPLSSPEDMSSDEELTVSAACAAHDKEEQKTDICTATSSLGKLLGSIGSEELLLIALLLLVSQSDKNDELTLILLLLLFIK